MKKEQQEGRENVGFGVIAFIFPTFGLATGNE